MGLDQSIDITAGQRNTVLALLERHLPNTAAWIYGSRAKWTANPRSDLDLVVFATLEQHGLVSALREAFEESNLPFRVDLFVWDDVPESFRRQIEAERVVLVDKEDSGVASEWRTTTLRDANVTLIDCDHRTPPAAATGFPYVAIPQLRAGRINLSSARRISQKHYVEWTRKAKPAENDVVLSRRCNPGESAVVPLNTEFALGQNLVLLRADGTKVFTPFLRWLVRGPEWWEQVGKLINVGAVFDSLKCADVPNFELRLPPLTDQRAIAHILGTLDDKIELNRRMNETLEAMARALFKSWFVDFDPVRAKMEGLDTGLPKHIADLFPDRLVASELGEIPKGWKVGTLEDVASLNPESWSTRNAPEEIVYVDLSNTKWGYIEKVETYSWKAAPSRGRRVLRHGDTIVGTVRPGNGSFSLVGRDGLTGSTGFAVLRPKTPSDAELVWCAATSQDNIDRLAHLADGGAYPAVRPEAVAATKLPLADFATRGAFSSVAASLLNQVDANKQQSHTLADLRDTLLPRLISGELRAKQIEPESSISNISPDATGVQA